MSDDAERVRRARETGRVVFMGLELLALPGALVPREETELLARAAIAKLREVEAGGREARAIDMCCGAGNVACAIAHHVPRARVWASDLTDGAVANARANVAHLFAHLSAQESAPPLDARVEVAQGDLFAPLAGRGLEGTIDVVACNPPYISTGRLEKDRKALLEAEPREAFDGGPYGLSIHQRVIRDALPFLRPGGWLMFEIGLGQERQVGLLFRRASGYAPLGAAMPVGKGEADKADEAKEEGPVRVAMAQKA